MEANPIIPFRWIRRYIWGILSQTTRLIHFFFDNGSRSAEVLHKRIADYKGTLQSDGYIPYQDVTLYSLDVEYFPWDAYTTNKT
ncbi:MAG: IS66 family transposase [Bacteroidales bacterium]